MDPFARRLHGLPRLGIGVSTEYGAARTAASLDVQRLAREHPAYAAFLEIGVEVHKGIDHDARAWIAQQRPCTYHFLDVNLDDARDLDDAWLAGVNALTSQMKPAWLCGDAGLWHFGARDRAQMMLLPPILVDDAASAMARGVARLREATGLEVLPENPPGTAYIGDLHLLEFFARVVERADAGMLLDVAHLALYQRVTGHHALFGLDAFPLERVIEAHVAGGSVRDSHGFAWIEDSHGTDVLDDTWRIFDFVCARAKNLRAVVFECERNANEGVLPGFARIESAWSP
ncbi:MAG TPA: DUF692 family protein [Myxococcota bacterium]